MKRYAAWLCAALLALPALVPAQTSPAAPVPGGLCPERLARIAPAMNRLLDEGKFPGISVTVARRGAVAYRQEFGFADLAAKTPLRKDAIYRIFSMSKPVTGVAVMILLEEGRFRLDDPVSLYLPSFKGLRVLDAEQGADDGTVEAAREVTIRDLLRHTSGLVYGGAPTTPLGRIHQARSLSTRPPPRADGREDRVDPPRSSRAAVGDGSDGRSGPVDRGRVRAASRRSSRADLPP